MRRFWDHRNRGTSRPENLRLYLRASRAHQTTMRQSFFRNCSRILCSAIDQLQPRAPAGMVPVELGTKPTSAPWSWNSTTRQPGSESNGSKKKKPPVRKIRLPNATFLQLTEQNVNSCTVLTPPLQVPFFCSPNDLQRRRIIFFPTTTWWRDATISSISQSVSISTVVWTSPFSIYCVVCPCSFFSLPISQLLSFFWTGLFLVGSLYFDAALQRFSDRYRGFLKIVDGSDIREFPSAEKPRLKGNWK